MNTRLHNLLRHIENVKDDCLLLGGRLIESGQENLGRTLIANGQIHDNSKFYGIEWEYLNDGQSVSENKELFLAAVQQHVSTNPHHPEYWPDGIKEMGQVYLAEMVADWHARASEFGTDLWEWIKERATEKFGFNYRCQVYKDIKKFTEMLLEKKFL